MKRRAETYKTDDKKVSKHDRKNRYVKNERKMKEKEIWEEKEKEKGKEKEKDSIEITE